MYVAFKGSFGFVQFAATPPDHTPLVADPPTLPPIASEGIPSQKDGNGSVPTSIV